MVWMRAGSCTQLAIGNGPFIVRRSAIKWPPTPNVSPRSRAMDGCTSLWCSRFRHPHQRRCFGQSRGVAPLGFQFLDFNGGAFQHDFASLCALRHRPFGRLLFWRCIAGAFVRGSPKTSGCFSIAVGSNALSRPMFRRAIRRPSKAYGHRVGW